MSVSRRNFETLEDSESTVHVVCAVHGDKTVVDGASTWTALLSMKALFISKERVFPWIAVLSGSAVLTLDCQRL
jgi:hypothetical protein